MCRGTWTATGFTSFLGFGTNPDGRAGGVLSMVATHHCTMGMTMTGIPMTVTSTVKAPAGSNYVQGVRVRDFTTHYRWQDRHAARAATGLGVTSAGASTIDLFGRHARDYDAWYETACSSAEWQDCAGCRARRWTTGQALSRARGGWRSLLRACPLLQPGGAPITTPCPWRADERDHPGECHLANMTSVDICAS
jgi:hypothetical protein